jgi:hypothetical protein
MITSPLRSLEIPTIWCPIRHRIHLDADGVDDRLLAWAKQSDLIRGESAAHRFYHAGYGRFCALAYPVAVRLDLMAQWMGHTWLVDDLLDEGYPTLIQEQRLRIGRELVAQLPLDLRAPRPSGPLFEAMADLWKRAAEPMSPAWRKRFVAHYRDFLSSSLLRHAPMEPVHGGRLLSTYKRRRRMNSGVEFSFDLIESANLGEVPESVTGCDTYKSVHDAAADAIAWTNDIFSVRKETARGDHDHLVVFLRETTHRGWNDALSEAARMVEEATRDYLIARADLRRLRTLVELDDEEWRTVEDSFAGIDDWIAGSLHWHAGSPRYSVVETTAEGRAPSYIEPHLGLVAALPT